MTQITLKPIRQQTTVTLLATLTDNGVKIDWSDLSVVKAYIYSESQRVVAGPCTVQVDGEDPTILRCVYDASKPQYLGTQKLVIYCEYEGQKNTYDKAAFTFVASTAATVDDGTTVGEDTTDVDITVEDVSSSILSGAIKAALDAAEFANETAESVQERADQDHTRAEEDHSTAAADHTTAAADHTTAAADHTQAAADHNLAAADHVQAGLDHTQASADHGVAVSDHGQAGQDHTRAESDHSTAASDHTKAGQDHTRAESDHTQAAADHTLAGTDHSTAAADHTQAASDHTAAAADHTLAGTDHSTAAADHTQALADHQVMAGYDTRLTNVEGEVSQLGQKTVIMEGGQYTPDMQLEQGSLGSTTGADTSSTTRIRTSNFITADAIAITTSGNKVYVMGYKNDGTFVASQGWITESQDVTISGADKYRLVFAYSNDAAITPSDFSSLNITIIAKCNGTLTPKTTTRDISQQLFTISGTLNVTAGTNHSSNDERLPIFIKQGDKFTILLSNGTGSVPTNLYIGVYAKYGEDASPTNIGSVNRDTAKAFTAENNITSLGFYVQGSSISQSGTLLISINNGVLQKVLDLEASTSNLVTLTSNLPKDEKNISVADASIYFTQGAQPGFSRTITSDKSMEVTVTYPTGGISYRIIDHNGVVLRQSGTSFGTKTIGNYQCLVFNRDTKAVEVVTYPVDTGKVYLPLLGVYGSSVFGALKPFYDRWLEKQLNESVEDIQEELSSVVSSIPIINRNKTKIERVKAASKTSVSGYSDDALPKNYVFVIATDIHNNIQCLKNAIDLADGMSVVDAVINLGDQQNSYYKPSDLANIQAAVTYGTKPKFIVLGNHDVGNSAKIRYTCNHQQAYEAYIKPMVDAGYLANGEYQENKCYYYHDLATQKLRIIVLNFYDETIELADSDYWEPVPYDSSKPLMTDSTSYQVGDIVNCGVYTDYSFRCKANCTSGTASNSSSMQEPLYKMLRGYGAIQQAQAQWFLDTLLSTPQDYSVLVVSHSVFSQNVTALTSAKFCQNHPLSASIAQDKMGTDFIAEAVNAFENGSNFSINVAFTSVAAYMNVQGDYAYTVSKDFSGKNTGVKFIGYVNGHFHEDIIWQHNTYTSQRSISPITSSPNASLGKNQDVYRSTDTGDVNYDALTVVGIDTTNAKMCLARIGADVSTDMYMRDIEKV